MKFVLVHFVCVLLLRRIEFIIYGAVELFLFEKQTCVKREAGGSPARSRHCKPGVYIRYRKITTGRKAGKGNVYEDR